MKKLYVFILILAPKLLFTNNDGVVDKAKFLSQNIKSLHNIVDILIIGSGPAGLSAAIASARSEYKTVVIQGPIPGGLASSATYMENYPGTNLSNGAQIINQLETQAKKFGAMLDYSTVKSINLSKWPREVILDDGTKLNALSIIIATGSTPKKLNVENEDKYWKKRIVSCALCDSPLTEGENVIVVGSNDIAIEQILQLQPYASSVTMISKHTNMEAAPLKQEKLKSFKALKRKMGFEIVKILGDDKNLTGVEAIDKSTGKTHKIKASWIFLAIGYEPNTELVKNQLQLKSNGTIKLIDENEERTQATSVEGVFGAGIVTEARYRQAGTCAGDGQKAGVDAFRYLNSLGIRDLLKANLSHAYIPKTINDNSTIHLVKNESELGRLVVESKKPILMEFFLPNCETCRSLDPAMASIVNEYGTKKLITLKLNRTEFKGIANELGIKQVPTFLVVKDQKIISELSGETFAMVNSDKTREVLENFVKVSLEQKA